MSEAQGWLIISLLCFIMANQEDESQKTFAVCLGTLFAIVALLARFLE